MYYDLEDYVGDLDEAVPIWNLTEILEELEVRLAATRERHPVLRSGARVPLCPLLRWLVCRRDGNACQVCGTLDTQGPMEVDHVIPWSANGRDIGTNLRLLCRRCNQSRSNWRLLFMPRLLPVTRACDDCVRVWVEPESICQYRLIHEHGCARCFAARMPWANELEVDDSSLAFCGQCFGISLVTNRLRLL